MLQAGARIIYCLARTYTTGARLIASTLRVVAATVRSSSHREMTELQSFQPISIGLDRVHEEWKSKTIYDLSLRHVVALCTRLNLS